MSKNNKIGKSKLEIVQDNSLYWCIEKENVFSDVKNHFCFDISLNDRIEGDYCWYRALDEKGLTLGYCWVRADDEVFEVSIAVSKQFRGNGVGMKLFEFALSRNENSKVISAVIMPENKNRDKIYKWLLRQGFEETPGNERILWNNGQNVTVYKQV
ncbi:MAG: hypothetical protein BM556_05600 [Bacteriovorax sp. MedPE-SWde]|nr:MAG: hypothetical protein BM556_05600 [Bacteriovorax sp. MedPE-SWde]